MKFYKYPKIHHLGKEETEGVINGYMYLQEKIDGANASVWIEDGVIKAGKRSSETNDFNGLPEYVRAHEGINSYLKENPTHHLFGEWLVRHTISYVPTAYNKFYLFDIGVWNYGDEKPTFLSLDEVYNVAEEYDIEAPELLWEGSNPSNEVIDHLVGKSSLGTKGEGIVLKPKEPFINKFGNSVYAKVVTQDFKERNGIVFGGNNKSSDTYNEMYICNKYMTLSRVKKIINKIEANLGRKLDKPDTSRVSMTCFNDMLVEEVWSIQKDVDKISFNALNRVCRKKAQIMFHDILNDHLSVAYKE